MQNTDRTLAIALIVSFASHSFMFIPVGKMFLLDRSKKPTKIEVTYVRPYYKNIIKKQLTPILKLIIHKQKLLNRQAYQHLRLMRVNLK